MQMMFPIYVSNIHRALLRLNRSGRFMVVNSYYIVKRGEPFNGVSPVSRNCKKQLGANNLHLGPNLGGYVTWALNFDPKFFWMSRSWVEL